MLPFNTIQGCKYTINVISIYSIAEKLKFEVFLILFRLFYFNNE